MKKNKIILCIIMMFILTMFTGCFNKENSNESNNTTMKNEKMETNENNIQSKYDFNNFTINDIKYTLPVEVSNIPLTEISYSTVIYDSEEHYFNGKSYGNKIDPSDSNSGILSVISFMLDEDKNVIAVQSADESVSISGIKEGMTKDEVEEMYGEALENDKLGNAIYANNSGTLIVDYEMGEVDKIILFKN